jgi:acyl carrier protein
VITNELKKVLLEALRLDNWDIREETKASEVPGWDSLNHVNVIMAVEEHFRVRFKTSEVLKLKSIGDLQRLVAANVRGTNTP